MVNRKTLFVLIALGAILFIAACASVFFLFRKVAPMAPKEEATVVVPQAKYAKGSAAFFYPASWKENDIPTVPGFISVQVVDEGDGIVFVASSAENMSEQKMNGTLVRNESITVGGIIGKEQRWENMESKTVILRVSDLKFEGKQYRFEMFGMLSRKVKMESIWSDILKSVQFEKGSEEGIKAAPQQ